MAKSLYEVLGLPREASTSDISRAYRRLALQFHPDRNPDGAEEFKKLSSAYAVLANQESRELYDRTGMVRTDAGGLSEAEQDQRTMQERSADIEGQLRAFFSTYAGSEEERADVCVGYKKCDGDFRKMVREYLLFDNGEEGEVRRLRGVTAALIQSGRLRSTEKWTRTSSEGGVAKAERDMASERAEAEEALREMGLQSTAGDGEGGLGALQALMQQRQQQSWESMVEGMEAKYGAKKSSGNAKTEKKGNAKRDAEKERRPLSKVGKAEKTAKRQAAAHLSDVHKKRRDSH